MSSTEINVGTDFHPDPGGRFYKDGNGQGSGEEFREELLMPALRRCEDYETVTIVLDNSLKALASSFLQAGFARAVDYGYIQADSLLSKLRFRCTSKVHEFYAARIKQYISEAKFNSQSYEPTERPK